jgi:hypothetical protein
MMKKRGRPPIPRQPPKLALLDGEEVAYIDLAYGHFAIINRLDLSVVQQYPYWRTHTDKNGVLRVRTWAYPNGVKTEIQMGRLILGLEKGDPLKVDHWNRNPLDNRRKNLRVATNQQNCCNSERPRGYSGLQGVTWHSPTKQWRARISVKLKRLHLGLFPTKELAYEAYKEAAKKYHGEFARFK